MSSRKNRQHRDRPDAAETRPIRSELGPAHNHLSDEPRDAEIRARAHEIYLSRVSIGAVGDALSDWLQAERELRHTSASHSVGLQEPICKTAPWADAVSGRSHDGL